jgi:hypothetical protein
MTFAPTTAHPGTPRFRRLVVSASVLAGAATIGLLYHFGVFGGSTAGSFTDGSGVAATQARDLPDFSGVELVGANNVLIHVGGRQSVVVRADDNLLERVTTKVEAGTLVIGNTPGSFSTKSPMSVEVTVPTLKALLLAGSGNVGVDGIRAESLNVSLPGSGTLTGSGTTDRLDVTVGGSGTVQFSGLVARRVHAVVGGSGTIFVTATEALDASVPGTGSVLYAGNPASVTKNVTGTGAITAT